MPRQFLPFLAAAALFAGVTTGSAQTPRSESAEQNVRQSEQYERLLCSNPSFRARRIAQECGPVTDPQLHESCVASFQCGRGAGRDTQWRQAPPSETVR